MALFVVSLPAVTPRLYSSDEVEYFSYLRSLYFDGDLSFENEYRYFHDRNIARGAGFHETFLERETAIGRRVNYATIGAAILWLPFYAAADAWTRATGVAEPNGFTSPYVAAVAYGSAFYGFLGLLLALRAAGILLGHGRNTADTPTAGSLPLLPAIAVWIGTPLLFYMYVAPPFAHACSAFAVAVFVNVWLRVREQWTPRGAFALGLSAALMTMVREQDAFLALGPAVDFLLTTARRTYAAHSPVALPRVRPRVHSSAAGLGAPNGSLATLSVPVAKIAVAAAISGAVAFLLGYSPQLLAYDAINGYPGPAEHVSRKMSWWAPHALQVLASPHHGFFFWTPLAVIAIVGLFAVRDRRLRTCLLIMVASQIYVAGSVESWTVAGAFGQRRFVCLTPLLVVGLTALWSRASSTRWPLAALIALCVWWNVALMAQFATRLMDRQRLEPARNAYHAFVTLPRLAPSLVHRYLTDRQSFYESQPRGADR